MRSKEKTLDFLQRSFAELPDELEVVARGRDAHQSYD
jgi:hypothetical protein